MMDEPSVLSVFLISAILLLILGHTVKLYLQNRWLAFDPLNLFWGGALVVYVYQAATYGQTLISWHSGHADTTGLEVFENTLMWILFGLSAVVIGYEAQVGKKLGTYILPSLPDRLHPKRLVQAALAVLGVGVLVYLYQFALVGGASVWLSSPRGISIPALGYINLLTTWVPLGVTLLLFHAEMHRVQGPKRILVWCLGSLMLLWFLYLGTRSRTIRFVIILLAAWYLPRQRNPSKMLLGVGALIMFVTVNFLADYRGNFRNLSFNLDQIDLSEAVERSLPPWLRGSEARLEIERTPDYTRGAELNCVMSVVELVPERVPYNFGYSQLEFLTRPIPRAFWPDKAYPHYEAFTPIYQQANLSSNWVEYGRQPILTGPAFTFIGHWLAVGGGLALAIAGFLTGALFRVIRTLIDRAPQSQGGMLLFVHLIWIGFLEAAATPWFWVFRLPFVLIPLLIILYWARFR